MFQIFDVGEDSVGVLTAKYNLEPPHYDGIQSLCLMGDLLFSGSRDMCIKKWNLAEQKLEQVGPRLAEYSKDEDDAWIGLDERDGALRCIIEQPFCVDWGLHIQYLVIWSLIKIM